MPDQFSYLSILNPGFPDVSASLSSVPQAGHFANVSLLNYTGGGTAGSTVTVTSGGSTYSTVVTIGASVFANSNNVSFGTNGSIVTATASFPTVTTARSDAFSNMGIWCGSASPGPGVQYSQWLAGSPGYFMWLMIP